MSGVRPRLTLTIGVFLYTAVLLVVVDQIIAAPFAYQGYVPRSWSAWEMMVGGLCTGALIGCLFIVITRPSQAAYLFLVATVGIPIVWIPVFYGPLPAPRVEVLQICAALTFIVMRVILSKEPRALIPLRLPIHLSWTALGLFVSGAFAVLFVLGLRPEILSFSEVYDQRDVYRTSGHAVTSYLVGWLAATLPFVMVLGCTEVDGRSPSLGQRDPASVRDYRLQVLRSGPGHQPRCVLVDAQG